MTNIELTRTAKHEDALSVISTATKLLAGIDAGIPADTVADQLQWLVDELNGEDRVDLALIVGSMLMQLLIAKKMLTPVMVKHMRPEDKALYERLMATSR